MSSDFEEMLNQYKGNYVEFLSTHDPKYKKAYELAQDSIEKMIMNKQKGVEDQKRDMNHFVESYKQDNEDMSGLYDDASGMYVDAQSIDDTYKAAKNRYDKYASGDTVPAVNPTNGYSILLRVGLVLLLLPLLFFLGFWSPSTLTTVAASPSPPSMNPMSFIMSPVLGPATTPAMR